MRGRRAAAFVVAALAPVILAASPESLSAGASAQAAPEARLDSRLAQVFEAYQRGGAAEAITVARSNDIDTEGDRVRVILETPAGRLAQAIAAANGLGAALEGTHAGLVQVLLPVQAIDDISRSPAATFIRPPLQAIPLITGEGVALTNTSAWQAQGLTGAGVKVAVLDLGFAGYTSLLGTELPATVTVQSFRANGDITGGGEKHGTGVAEIVHEMAPDAQLYLANFGTEVELANAAQWFNQQGVKIVNASWGYFTSGPGDGTGVVNDVITQSTADGILWAIAAGNHQQRHWSGAFNDTDADNWHEFQNTPVQDEGNAIGFLGVNTLAIAEVKWDDPFGAACRDYDLFLMRTDNVGALVTVASSQVRQYNGACVPNANPVERIAVAVPVTDTYHLLIRKHFSPTNANFHLFAARQDLQYRVTANSLMQPGDNPNALTVGAVYWNTPSAIESFSSLGPTTDGRTKPDIAGPDGVSNATYAPSGFFGTSAASPHIAGAAALARQLLPCYTPAGLKIFLETQVVDLGAAGKDNTFGSGRLALATPPLDTDTDGTADSCDADDDADAWSDIAEAVIGTNALLACGPDTWPPDLDGDSAVDTADIAMLTNDFGNAVPVDAPPRHDIGPDPPNGFVDTADIAMMTNRFGKPCPP